MKTKMKLAVFAAAALSALALPAATWYVDAAGGNDSNDGSTPAKAVKTLSAAMALTGLADGDTVVALPGTYESGTMSGSDGASARVVVTKAITLKSLNGRATRDVTIIKGEKGESPVRCVTIAPGAGKTASVEGLTLLEGGTSTDGGDASSNRGGGALVLTGTGYVVDCLIKNCAARTGGGMAMASSNADGGAARCHFTACTAKTAGLGVNNVPVWYCVFSDFPTASIQILYHAGSKPRACIQCTFYCNATCSYVAGPMLNSLIVQSAPLNDKIYATNCVASVTLGANFTDSTGGVASPTFMIAPAAGDYRAIAGQTGINYGVEEHLLAIPSRFRNIDFNGEAVVATDGKVTVGACTVPVTPAGGYFTFGNFTDFSVDGRAIAFAWTRFYVDGAAKSFNMTLPTDVFAVTNSSGVLRYPDRDGVVRLAPPASGTENLYTDQASGVFTVGEGEEHATIKSAVEAASDRAIVMVKPGTYATGETFGLGVTNRVFIPDGKNIRLVSTEGPEVTFIEGAAATSPVVGERSKEEFGLGSDAVRCIAVEATGNVQIDGFTIRNGHTDYDGQSSPANDNTGYGGGIYCYRDNVRIDNCIVTNCFAVRGGGVCNGEYVNCRILDNVAVYVGSAGHQTTLNGGSGQSLKLHNCLVDGNWGCYRVLFYWNLLDSCTFGTRNHGASSSAAGVLLGNSVGTLQNCLFLRGHNKTEAVLSPVNCAYVTDFQWKDGSTFTDCKTAAAFDVDAGYVPVGNAGNVLVGTADASLWDSEAFGDKDLAGRPRLRSGSMDIGCYQADWSAACAAKLDPRGRVALDASNADERCESEGVRLLDGSMTMVQTKYVSLDVPVTVAGPGCLIVRQGGRGVAAFAAGASGSVSLLRNAEYLFEYIPGANDSAGALLAQGIAVPVGAMLIFR